MNTDQRITRAAFLVAFALCFSAGFASAGSEGGFRGGVSGGYSGPGPVPITVQQALTMRDDVPVTLRGYIIQRLGGDRYLFRDTTGSIQVEIDDDDWRGQIVGPDDLVELSGKVDRDWNSVEIEVKRIAKP